MRALALLLLLPACGPDPNTDLAALADRYDLRLLVQPWEPSDVDPTFGYVVLSYDEARFAFDHDGACAVLGGDLGGYLGDAELDLVARGSDDEDFGGCYAPKLTFVAELAADQPTSLVLADDTRTVTAEFAPGTLSAHHPILRSHPAWQFRGGEEVRVGWSHPEDLADWRWDEWTVYFNGDDDMFPLNAGFVGDEIFFTVPSPPPTTGGGIIRFRFGWSSGDATRCDATACTYNTSLSFDHSATISR